MRGALEVHGNSAGLKPGMPSVTAALREPRVNLNFPEKMKMNRLEMAPLNRLEMGHVQAPGKRMLLRCRAPRRGPDPGAVACEFVESAPSGPAEYCRWCLPTGLPVCDSRACRAPP